MKPNKFDNISLPKWAALCVVGDKITKDQAILVNFRTNGFDFSTNDHEFHEFAMELFEVPELQYESFNRKYYDTTVLYKWKPLHTLYLNNSNIMSSFINGTHGWCKWDGTIFTNSYNIGKYPSVEAVTEELKEIAKEFTFLNMKVQLFSGETSSEDNKPLIQFNVKNGKVTRSIPKHIIVPPIFEFSMASLYDNNREHIAREELVEYYSRFKELMKF